MAGQPTSRAGVKSPGCIAELSSALLCALFLCAELPATPSRAGTIDCRTLLSQGTKYEQVQALAKQLALPDPLLAEAARTEMIALLGELERDTCAAATPDLNDLLALCEGASCMAVRRDQARRWQRRPRRCSDC